VTTEKASINESRKISAIWFIPLLAAALGIYMVVHNFMTEGPEIEISFSTATGLEQGKTKIKYRNVSMGVVEDVRLNEGFDGVIAKAKLDRQTLPLLREDTRFWVVTARVGVGNVTGLDTLLSGAYIQLAPGEGEEGARKFVALEQPPLTPAGAPGLRLHLSSERSSSITAGDAVLYNGYKVGRVESMEFRPNDRKLHYTLFIDAPYHELVDSHTRFWDISGLSLSAGAEGFKLETGSIDTILLGGVAFGLPPGIGKGKPVEKDAVFTLYASFGDILDNPYRHGAYYVVIFAQSVKGLLPGAPVEYRGLVIGRVERVMIKESINYSFEQGTQGHGADIPVLIYLEPGRLEMPDDESSIEDLNSAIRAGVANGMRATLETGSLLTGAKFVNIDYYEGVEPAEIGSFFEYPTLPSLETGLGQLEQKLNALLDKINDLPIDHTVAEANNAIATLNDTLESLNRVVEDQGTQDLPAQLNETLRDLQSVMEGFSSDSGAYQSINSSLLRLNRTLGNMESLTRTLNDKPNAVVFPSSTPPDPVPEVNN
jgi:paraquat-inducible protein B